MVHNMYAFAGWHYRSSIHPSCSGPALLSSLSKQQTPQQQTLPHCIIMHGSNEKETEVNTKYMLHKQISLQASRNSIEQPHNSFLQVIIALNKHTIFIESITKKCSIHELTINFVTCCCLEKLLHLATSSFIWVLLICDWVITAISNCYTACAFEHQTGHHSYLFVYLLKRQYFARSSITTINSSWEYITQSAQVMIDHPKSYLRHYPQQSTAPRHVNKYRQFENMECATLFGFAL